MMSPSQAGDPLGLLCGMGLHQGGSNGALTAASMLPSLPGRLLSTPTPAASASDPEETTTFSYGRDSGLNAGEPIVGEVEQVAWNAGLTGIDI